MKILARKFENVFLFFNNKNYRVFVRLLIRYGKISRNNPREISFLKYKIHVPDCLSFVFQFKEIFVKKYYLFQTESKIPVIYDCGANIGISVLFFKSIYQSSKIKAFEADKNISVILQNNLVNNSINDVEVISKAVWVDNKGIDFSISGSDAGSIFGSESKTRVESIRLRTLIENENHINFLKMDIEGAETEVITDCSDLLYKVENIFIEFHSYVNFPQNLSKIISALESNNFRYFIKSEENRKSPFINKVNKEFPNTDLQLNIFAYREN